MDQAPLAAGEVVRSMPVPREGPLAPSPIIILWLILPGHEFEIGRYTNIHSCSGRAALERHALTQVERKTGKKLEMKFICKTKE